MNVIFRIRMNACGSPHASLHPNKYEQTCDFTVCHKCEANTQSWVLNDGRRERRYNCPNMLWTKKKGLSLPPSVHSSPLWHQNSTVQSNLHRNKVLTVLSHTKTSFSQNMNQKSAKRRILVFNLFFWAHNVSRFVFKPVSFSWLLCSYLPFAVWFRILMLISINLL